MQLRTFVVAALVVGSFLMAGCAGGGGGSTPTQAAGTKVMMVNLKYDPETVSVKTGSSVTWENGESISHTVTFDDASMSGKSSKSLNTKGAKHTATFDTAGTFTYHCDIPGHATKGSDGKWTGMVGTVTVTA